jgi:hypothetical protein
LETGALLAAGIMIEKCIKGIRDETINATNK